ncbi:MAG: hypothetical protein Q8O52_18000 [Sulfuritalea sp.]|nr:hypothetical protein [Sulfuritalea sp.]
MPGMSALSRAAAWHKWLGLALSIPLLGWVVSSVALVVITFDIPNGLQGVYQLQPYNSVDLPLDRARISPVELLRRIEAEHGIARVHWLRLESRGSRLWYVVRPTPFSQAMTFDAVTGERLDPLPDSLMVEVANEALAGTRVESFEPVLEFNRDYGHDRLPAIAARMKGEQPSVLILARDSGRTLRRMDADAESFHWWYKTFHVNQYSDHVIPWTTLLYLCAVGVMTMAVLGYLLFWWRRPRILPARAKRDGAFSARNLHRKAGVIVGGVLLVQLAAGIYIWLSLGPLNPAFRGKPSFNANWRAGIPTSHALAGPAVALTTIAGMLPRSARPVQAIEWRRVGDIDLWAVSPRRDEPPLVFNAGAGARIERLPPALAGELARGETSGEPAFDYLGPLHFASMDLNRRLPAYRFRFHDAASTDVYVLQSTGEVVMRRPEFWRVFGPFLATHMLAVTKNKTVDIVLLGCFQLGFLIMIVTGWRLQFPGKKARTAPVGGAKSPPGTPNPMIAGADAVSGEGWQ